MGYVSGRMTGSNLAITLEIGTQRIHGAGQHRRLEAGTCDCYLVRCQTCKIDWNLEERFPDVIRVNDRQITPEMGHDRDANYILACPKCGLPLDRDSGRCVPSHPERAASGHFSVRVSQLAIGAISLQEIVGAWYSALADPGGDALVAFHCDRLAIPKSGAAQPITPAVLERSRARAIVPGSPSSRVEPGACSPAHGGLHCVAGLDTGPRSWLWVDEILDAETSQLVRAELIASGNVPGRLPRIISELGIGCVFIDAGGEPDLTKRLCLALNGLDSFRPPAVPRNELLKMRLSGLGHGLAWDGGRGMWSNVRAAAVLFSSREAKGIEQTIGFTQDGRIYPLIKCNRAESIQTAVNDFLTPAEGVIELLDDSACRPDSKSRQRVREQPRARLLPSHPGPGVSREMLDSHLLNLRRVRDPRTGMEDWADGLENHLGLAKTYARLAHLLFPPRSPAGAGSLTERVLSGPDRSCGVPRLRRSDLDGFA
jgi:hypothetical protein